MFLLDRFNAARVTATVILQSLKKDFGGLKIHLMSTEVTLGIIDRVSIDEIPDIELMADVSNLRIRLETLKYQLVYGMETDEVTQEFRNDILKAAESVEAWGKRSAATCEGRLEKISTQEELLELRVHFDALKAAAEIQTQKA